MTVTVYPIRRGADLGRQNLDCTARRHGTYSAYARGCRCPHARDAHRIYQKRHREGRLGGRLLDATGTRRRIQALWAIAHPSTSIAAAAGPGYTAKHVCQISKRPLVTIATHEAVRRAYRTLAGVPGVSVRTRRRALASGYPGPSAWDDDEIDDPAVGPWVDGGAEVDVADWVKVDRALSGRRTRLTPLERHHAVHVGELRRMPLSRVAVLLHVSYATARALSRKPLPAPVEGMAA